MYNYLYSRPLWLVGFCLLFLAVVWSRADEQCAVSRRRTVAWKLLNLALLLVSLLFIVVVSFSLFMLVGFFFLLLDQKDVILSVCIDNSIVGYSRT